MADLEIIDLTAASALDGTELFYGIQGGADRKVTTAQIRAGLLPLAGGAMSGDIVLLGDPSAANHPATKTYVDTGLAAKAASSHAHAATDVSDFAESVDDRVNALLVEGANITLTYDDTANTLTIDAAGGGGGGYSKLVASGANDGTFTFKDDTVGSGVTTVEIYPGDTQGFGTTLAVYPSSSPGMPALYCYGGSTGAYVGTFVGDYWEQHFSLSPGGLTISANGAINFGSDGSIYSPDARLKRTGVGIVAVETMAGDLAGLEVGTLYLDDGVSVLPAQIGPDNSGPGGAGRALFVANA